MSWLREEIRWAIDLRFPTGGYPGSRYSRMLRWQQIYQVLSLDYFRWLPRIKFKVRGMTDKERLAPKFKCGLTKYIEVNELMTAKEESNGTC
jgi:hypothetical protein